MRSASALAHPIVVSAAALILVNDFVLRRLVPGWLTGKLSDVGWLVVVPVVLAVMLGTLGVPERLGRWAGMAVAAGFYTALQLWPPLGAWFRLDHVADVGDLIALPALVGALVVWRMPRAAPRWATMGAWPILLGTLAADEFWFPPEATWPCGDDMVWGTSEPLRLQLSWWPPYDTDGFVRGMRMTDTEGADVPLVVGKRTGAILVCARGGLRPDTGYTWHVGPWQETPSNEVVFQHEALPTVTFRTSDEDGSPAADATACAALAHGLDDATDAACNGWGDTGDTGDTAVSP